MKTDLQLHKDVIEELRWDPRVNEAEIGVSAKSGVVTLSGSVQTYAQKYAAERAVQRVAGVHGIADELSVRPSGTFLRNDTDIAHSAVNALTWDIEVPSDKITATIESGWLTLKGKVNWNFQKKAAERAVRYLGGVKGIANLIEVKPMVSPVEVKNEDRGGAQAERGARRKADQRRDQRRQGHAEGQRALVGGTRRRRTRRLGGTGRDGSG